MVTGWIWTGVAPVILTWGKNVAYDHRDALIFNKREKKLLDILLSWKNVLELAFFKFNIKKGVSDFRNEYIVQKVVCGT